MIEDKIKEENKIIDALEYVLSKTGTDNNIEFATAKQFEILNSYLVDGVFRSKLLYLEYLTDYKAWLESYLKGLGIYEQKIQ